MEPRHVIARTLGRIYARGQTTASGGNLSIRDERGTIWITPSALDKGTLDAADVVGVATDGTREGAARPSSELPFHAAIYDVRPDVDAIVHAHPASLVAFAICHAVPVTASGVVSVPYALTGTERLASAIAHALGGGATAALLENHGVVVVGRDMREAALRFEMLERAARIEIRARHLGPILDGAAGTIAGDLPPPTRADGGPAQAFVERGLERDLLAPAGDLVSCDGGDARHASIRDAHPETRAVISATPINAMAFAITGTPFDSRAMAESHYVLREVVGAADRLAPDRPVAISAAGSVVTTGRTLLEAYDRLEVLDATAAALIDARAVGEAKRLGASETAELDELWRRQTTP